MMHFLLYVMVFSFLGWVVEVAFHAVKTGRFVNRGFCSGPVCPIYGFGIGVVWLCLRPLAHTWVALFFASVALTSLLEFLTGFVMDKCFATKWWDYSRCRFNLGGYICLTFSLIWGACCMMVVKLLFPPMDWLYSVIPPLVLLIAQVVFFTVLCADATVSVFAAAGLKRQLYLLDTMAKQLKTGSDAIGARVFSGTMKLEEQYEALMRRTGRWRARLLRAFPGMSSNRYGEQLAKLKERFSLRRREKKDTKMSRD